MQESEQGFRWDLRVASNQRDRASVFARRHSFEVGAPLGFDAAYERITALEYALGALGADLVNGLQEVARRKRVALDHVEALVQGKLHNALTYLGVVGEQGSPGLERVTIKVYISTLEPEENVRGVWEEMLSRSPLVHTFRNAALLDLSLQVRL